MSGDYIPVDLRRRVTQAAGRRCGFCRSHEDHLGTALDIEHIRPKSKGGRTWVWNLWLVCHQCNMHKAAKIVVRDPVTGARIRLYNPRRDRWPDHFAWSAAGTHILGLTPKGRATVEEVWLNRPELVAARHVWIAAGCHPPD